MILLQKLSNNNLKLHARVTPQVCLVVCLPWHAHLKQRPTLMDTLLWLISIIAFIPTSGWPCIFAVSSPTKMPASWQRQWSQVLFTILPSFLLHSAWQVCLTRKIFSDVGYPKLTLLLAWVTSSACLVYYSYILLGLSLNISCFILCAPWFKSRTFLFLFVSQVPGIQ